MPVGRRFDFQIANRGYMLQRGTYKGRTWQRVGRADTPGQRTTSDARFGVLPDELDHPEVWDDWSGGMGYAYRRPENAGGYHWAENFDARFPRQLVHCQAPVLAKGTVSINNSYAYLLENADGIIDSSPVLAPPDEGSGTVTLFARGGWTVSHPRANGLDNLFILPVTATTTQVLHGAAVYGSFVYVGDQLGIGWWQNATGSLEPMLNSYRFQVVGNRLWRAHGPAGYPNQAIWLQNCADPNGVATAANWSATINVGNYRSGIKSMVCLDDQLYGGIEHGLIVGDQSGTFVNVLSELAGQAHPDNARDLTVYKGAVIVPHIAGLFAYLPGDYTGNVVDITPPHGASSPTGGRVRAVRGYGQWLYGGQYTGSQSWLMACDWQGNRPIWHTLQRLPHTTKISRIHFDSITTASGGVKIPNRCWVLTDPNIDTSGTAPIYYWPVPVNNGNPLMPSPAFSPNYVGSAFMALGATDWGAPGTPKIFREVEVWADNLNWTCQYCNIYYSVDNEATRHHLSTFGKSPYAYAPFPSAEGSFITGQSIELFLESFTCSAGITPIYHAVVLRGALQPRSVDMVTAVVRVADNLTDRQGQKMRSGATMLQELRDFGNPDRQGLQAHQLIDLAGATEWVKVLGPVEEQEVWQQGAEEPEIAATVKMAVLTFTTG